MKKFQNDINLPIFRKKNHPVRHPDLHKTPEPKNF